MPALGRGGNLLITVGTVGTTATKSLVGRRARRALTVQNTHATQVLYAGPANPTLTASNGVKVNAGETVPLGPLQGDLWLIGSGSGTNFRLAETF